MRHPVHLDPGRPPAEVLQHPLQAPLAPRPRQAPPPPAAARPRPATSRVRRRATVADDRGTRPRLRRGREAGLTAGPACPHCRKPVALVAWLVPPAAATVKEPPRHADTVRDNP